MRSKPAQCWRLGLVLALTVVACGPSLEEDEPTSAPEESSHALPDPGPSSDDLAPQWDHPGDPHVLVPDEDLDRDDMTGVPDNRRLYRNIDDGTDDDGSSSYITLEKGRRDGSFKVGFSNSPDDGTVTEVEVHYTAQRHDSKGRAWVELYDGSRRLGRGDKHTLHSDWRDFEDRFTGLSVASASTLRVRLFLETTSGKGGLRVTSLWLRIKTKPEEPEPSGPRRVDAFLFRDISTCYIGNRCVTEPCRRLSDSSGTPRVLFADDGSYRAVPPGDPAIATAEVVQCVHLRLSDEEVAARRAELERYRDDVARWTAGDLTLDLRIHELDTVELSLSNVFGELWIGPGDARPVIFPFLSRDTDFVLVTPAVRDPDLDLHQELPACGLAFGADFGVGGAGYSWIPDTASSFFFQCADHGVYTHEWLHQLHFAVHVLSAFDDEYDGAYPACGTHVANTRRWFPDTHECNRDPDAPFCGAASCGTNDEVNEHVLTAHWPPEPLEELVTNHCRNGIQDYGETGVDVGPDCPNTLRSSPNVPAPASPAVPIAEPLPRR